MKKTISIILALCVFFSLLSIGGVNAVNSEVVDIYVSLAGDDTNDGVTAPVKTIGRAKEIVREYNSENDVTVHIAEGEYVLSETVKLTNQDGGHNGHFVKYIGENAVISGGEKIKGWTIHDRENNIYKAEDVTFDFAQLYVNDVKQPRAKDVPLNDPYSQRIVKAYRESTTVDGVTYPENCIVVDGSIAEKWNNLKDVKIKILAAWTDNILPVESVEHMGDKAVIKVQKIAEERVFNRPHPDITGYSHENTIHFVCWFENAYEFINETGEWYLDKSKDTLYYKAPEGMDMENVSVVAPKVETLLSIEGESDNMIKNITFEGITFAHSTWLCPNEEGVVGGQASQYVLKSALTNVVSVYRPPSAVYVRCGENINFISNTFMHTGSTALDYHYGTKGGLIEGNVFKDISGNGINIAKFFCDDLIDFHDAYNPTDTREICDGQIIRNNYVTRIGIDYEGSVGIAAGYPKNITIENNTISHTPYSGISVGFGWTSSDNAMRGNKILRNHIHNVGEVLCDGAAIYTLSKQPSSEMAYNFVHDFDRKEWFDYGCAGIYLDEQTSGYNMHDNLMFNCPGIWQNRTGTNTLKNNGAIYNAEIIFASGVQGEYMSILPEEELPQIPNQFVPENENARKSEIISTNAPLATDGKTETGQKGTKDDEFIFEVAGNEFITDVVIKKKYEADGVTGYDYWPDWIFAVGCEVQGSYDKENWETIGVCHTWPDNMPRPFEEVFSLDSPKAYKYVRYVRVKEKTSSDYGAWLFKDDYGNRLHLADIEIYTAPFEGVSFLEKVQLKSDSAPLAIDENTDTAQASDKNGEFVFELEEAGKVSKVVLKKQKYAAGVKDYGYYWPDWIFAVGCEVQGSMDGKNWETLGVCNTWPDNTGDIPEDVLTVETPKLCKYVRYVRTTEKTSSGYGAWLFKEDYGNRLNLAEIEVYVDKKDTVMPFTITKAEYTDEENISVEITSLQENASGVLIAALFTPEGELKRVKTVKLDALNFSMEFKKESGCKVSLYIWNSEEDMMPLSKMYTVE